MSIMSDNMFMDIDDDRVRTGARMYGAFWCSHCQEQKLAFGREAQPDLPYIECFPEGYFSAKV